MVEAVSPLPAPAGPSGEAPRARTLEEAAGQFEALLIGQLLRSMHESGGWLGCQDSASDSLTGLAEQQRIPLHADWEAALQRAESGRADARNQSVPK